MKKILGLTALVLVLIGAQPVFAYESDLDGLLNDHVKPVTAKGIKYNGVNYDAWGKDPRHVKVRDAILAKNPSSLKSKNKKLAYWINAYNVLTIDLITREGERDSIKNLGSTFTSAWKKHKWTIAGKEYALDDIEHSIIRPMGEARIHFAVNCAAKSCPDLRAEAYRANKLDAQLEDQTLKTFANKTKGYQKLDGNSVKVSKVMSWFKKDFDNGDLNSWMTAYFPDVVDSDTNIRFFSYDWSLNKQ